MPRLDHPPAPEPDANVIAYSTVTGVERIGNILSSAPARLQLTSEGDGLFGFSVGGPVRVAVTCGGRQKVA